MRKETFHHQRGRDLLNEDGVWSRINTISASPMVIRLTVVLDLVVTAVVETDSACVSPTIPNHGCKSTPGLTPI